MPKPVLDYFAAKDAQRAKERGIEAASGRLGEQYGVSKGYIEPYYQTGTAANALLAQRLGIGGDANAPGYGELLKPFSMADYQQDPGYQFRLQEGLKQLQGRAAARGGALSGATLKGVQGYSQGLASQEYGNAYQRYMDQQRQRYNMLAEQQGGGWKAAGALADLSTGYGANLANLALGKGNVQAEGTMAKYGAFTKPIEKAENFVYNVIGSKFGAPNAGTQAGEQTDTNIYRV